MLAKGCQLKLAAEKSCLDGRGEGREKREGRRKKRSQPEENGLKRLKRGELAERAKNRSPLPPPVGKQEWPKGLHALCPPCIEG